jgi:hypothetical protein
MVPNLYLVGFQKCGSSSLYKLLSQHPKIAVTQPKETFALVDDCDEHYNPVFNVRNDAFSWQDIQQNSLQNINYFLEGSVCNFYQNTALDYIKSKKNQPKVIFIIRDPIKRFRSAFMYYTPRITNYQPIKTLNEFYKVLKFVEVDLNVDGAKYALQHGEYCRYISRWEYALGKDSIKVISFEALVKYPEQTASEIFVFLELKHVAVTLNKENITKNIKYRQLNHYLKQIFSGSGLGKTKLGEVYLKLNRTHKKESIPETLQQQLEIYYKAEYKTYGDKFTV